MYDDFKALEGVHVPSLNDFWEWVKKTFTSDYKKEIEAYLADSVDHCDLEERIKFLYRRGMI